MEIIADIYNDYDSKFGIPRQSGIINSDESYIVFRKEYRINEALRGLEQFNYIWLIWGFSECDNKKWTPTVRPPRLGGNKRMGVFATRSPFRPNSLGLSSVKLIDIIKTEDKGTILKICGADLMNGTPIYDIKPYLPYADCHSDAKNGFALTETNNLLNVVISDELINRIPRNKETAIKAILAQDPRPQYINDDSREYGMSYAGLNIRFTVKENTLTVINIE